MPVTQFDDSSNGGLVKFDFLGLKTLSVLKKAVELLAAQGILVDLDRLMPWDDPAVYALLQRGETVGVFQLESEGMRRTLAGVKPTSFADIIALVSLYRPGPMDNIPAFGDRKNGPPRSLSPPLARGGVERDLRHLCLSGAGDGGGQVLAGQPREAILRHAMAKKIKSEMDAAARRCRQLRSVNDIAQPPTNCSTDRQIRRIRLQQTMRPATPHRLPDRFEDPPSGRILRRIYVLRHGANRQARHLRR
jgi:DNA polymerase-3 subunit alpha